MKLGTRIFLSPEGLNADIIAHELEHAELYSRIGFIAQKFMVPAWFDEDLTMQLDPRLEFSEYSLRKYCQNLKQLTDIRQLRTGQEFMSGSKEEVLLYDRQL